MISQIFPRNSSTLFDKKRITIYNRIIPKRRSSYHDKLKPAKFGSNRNKVDYFGIDKNSDTILRKTVHVMFYNSSRDFAVAINTQGADIVYLYRTNDDVNFDKLYSDMFIKRSEFSGNSDFTDKDELKVPNINLYKEQSFNELCGREVKGTKFMIDQKDIITLGIIDKKIML